MHEDELLASRVSFFLLAQSILIAATASSINTFVGLSKPTDRALRPEIFYLSLALSIVGLFLTLISWYVLKLNFINIGIVMERLKAADPLYTKLEEAKRATRQSLWYFRPIFRENGVNRVVTHKLPLTLMLLWVFTIILLVCLRIKSG